MPAYCISASWTTEGTAELDMAKRALSAPLVGETPVVVLHVQTHGIPHTVFLKDERVNPTGSIKDRTAEALVRKAIAGGNPTSVTGIVESTSGNLGAALALQAAHRGVRFLAVVDPRLTGELQAKIRALGGELELASHADAAGNYLLARIARVRELAESGKWLWTNQYENPAAADVHRLTTGPELRYQVAGRLDELYVSVSTCGTLVGLGRYISIAMPACTRIAVDLEGSCALGRPPGERHITGIGSAQRSSFDVRGSYDRYEIVTESEAIQTCRFLAERTGIRVGASTGASVAACFRRLRRSARPLRALCLIADGGDNYSSTVYCDDWLRDHRIELTSADWETAELAVVGTIESRGRDTE